MQPAAQSRTLARAILEAWSVGDPARVRTVLDRALAACSSPTQTTGYEEESMDLVAGAATTIRRSIGRADSKPTAEAPEIHVSLRLLRHVAR